MIANEDAAPEGGRANYEHAEELAIRDQLRQGAPPRCPRDGTAMHRNRATSPVLIKPLSRSMIAGAISSSSWAQTDAAQDTVSTPPRSATGVAWAATALPTASGHTR